MTTRNESFVARLGVVPPTERGDRAYNRIKGNEYQRRTGPADEGPADAHLPVPLYVIAAAALFG